MDALYESSQQAIQALVESDPMAAKIGASYFEFAEKVRAYHEISEQGYPVDDCYAGIPTAGSPVSC